MRICEACGQATEGGDRSILLDWLRELEPKRYTPTALWMRWERERPTDGETFLSVQTFSVAVVETDLVRRFRHGQSRYLVPASYDPNSKPRRKNPADMTEAELEAIRVDRPAVPVGAGDFFDEVEIAKDATPAGRLTDLGPLLAELNGTMPATPQEV